MWGNMGTARNKDYGGSNGVKSAYGLNRRVKIAQENDRPSSVTKAWENM
jgi:hypothetical protein